MISHISALVLTIQTIALLEIKYKMIICLFVSAGCVLPEIYSLRNKSSAHFIFASISTKQKYLEKKYFSFSLKPNLLIGSNNPSPTLAANVWHCMWAFVIMDSSVLFLVICFSVIVGVLCCIPGSLVRQCVHLSPRNLLFGETTFSFTDIFLTDEPHILLLLIIIFASPPALYAILCHFRYSCHSGSFLWYQCNSGPRNSDAISEVILNINSVHRCPMPSLSSQGWMINFGGNILLTYFPNPCKSM